MSTAVDATEVCDDSHLTTGESPCEVRAVSPALALSSAVSHDPRVQRISARRG